LEVHASILSYRAGRGSLLKQEIKVNRLLQDITNNNNNATTSDPATTLLPQQTTVNYALHPTSFCLFLLQDQNCQRADGLKARPAVTRVPLKIGSRVEPLAAK